MTGERVVRRLAAILAADVVGYSRLMGRDEHGTLHRLKTHRAERLEPALARHGGRLIKLTGDGALVEFPSAVDALGAAIEFQQAMAEVNQDQPDTAIVFRIGLHLGDLIVEGDDLYGDGMNIAARLEAEATPGGIVISRTVHEAVTGRLKATFDDLGSLTLKNIERPVQSFGVKWVPADWTATAPSIAALSTSDTPLRLPDKPSIAVLPFQNMSGDPDQEYFADGLAEDIITALSRVGWFFVTARNSSFAYKGKAVDIRQVGRELGVRYVLEGSIRKSGNRLRMTAQLIEASSGDHLWADKYDGTQEQVFDLQDQIVERLIGALEPKLRASEITRARQKRPESLTAFDLVLQALPKHATMTAEGFTRAIELLDRAIAIAPTYAQALGYAAWCRALRPFHGLSPDPAGDMREASALARRAFDSDPNDPIALRAVAITVVLVGKDYRAGLDLFDRSLAIDGNAALAWGLRGWVNVWAGEAAAAIEDFERALRLSPFDQWISNYANGMAFALNLAGRHVEALAWAHKCMQHNPHWSASHRQVIASHFLSGQHVEAKRAAMAYLQVEPSFTVHYWVETGPFRRTPEQERVFSALHLSGLPE